MKYLVNILANFQGTHFGDTLSEGVASNLNLRYSNSSIFTRINFNYSARGQWPRGEEGGASGDVKRTMSLTLRFL